MDGSTDRRRRKTRKSAGDSKRTTINKIKERYKLNTARFNTFSTVSYRSTNNSISDHSPEFEALWASNGLSKYFRYIGHQDQILIMQCIAYLRSELDGQAHFCGKRFRIRQGNYGNLSRHKELKHRIWIDPPAEGEAALMDDSMMYMPLSSNGFIGEQEECEGEICLKPDDVKLEFDEQVLSSLAVVYGGGDCDRNVSSDQEDSLSENVGLPSGDSTQGNNGEIYLRPEQIKSELNDSLAAAYNGCCELVDSASEQSGEGSVRKRHPNNRIDVKQMRFDEDVVALCADGFPADFVRQRSFKNLVFNLDPRIRLKGEQFYLQKLDYTIEKQIRPEIRKLLKSVESGCCHFSLDFWSTGAKTHVLSIKFHCITKDWVHVERTLAVQKYTKEQSNVNIVLELQNCLKLYGIADEKVGVIVMSDSSNLKKGFMLDDVMEADEDDQMIDEELDANENFDKNDEMDDSESTDDDDALSDGAFDEESDIKKLCSACNRVDLDLQVPHKTPSCVHELQLVVQDAVMADTVARHDLRILHRIATFFRKSLRWRCVLRSKIDGLSCSLVIPRKCCWKFVLDWLQMLSDETIYDAVRTTLHDAKMSSSTNAVKRNPESHELISQAKILELSFLLGGLSEAFQYLLADGATSQKVMLVVIKVFKDVKETSLWYYHDLKKSVLEGLVKRFEGLLKSDNFVIATICDPRQKFRLFGANFGEGSQLHIIERENAESILMHHYIATENKFGSSALSDEIRTVQDGRFQKSAKRKRDIIDEIDMIAPLAKVEKPIQSEVKTYLNEPCVSNDVDILQYWKQSAYRFPTLSKIAMRFLGVPTSSAAANSLETSRIGCDCCCDRRRKTSTNALESRVLYREYVASKRTATDTSFNLSNVKRS